MPEAVRVVGDEELQEATGTPGLHRRVAFESEGYWSGHVEAVPQAMSGWHHHGDNDTIGYILEGEIRIEYGRVDATVRTSRRATSSRFRQGLFTVRETR